MLQPNESTIEDHLEPIHEAEVPVVGRYMSHVHVHHVLHKPFSLLDVIRELNYLNITVSADARLSGNTARIKKDKMLRDAIEKHREGLIGYASKLAAAQVNAETLPDRLFIPALVRDEDIGKCLDSQRVTHRT